MAAAAYRSGTELYDDRTGLTHDYRRKQGVDDSFIMAPDNVPDWATQREELWNKVEEIEKRCDAQLARDLTLALPSELSPDERKKMLVTYVTEQFVSRGMVADVAMHAPDRDGDNRNFHAHVMLTMREISEQGFGNKNRDWNKTEVLETWRERWAHAQNMALERAGFDERVDHRSYEGQGKDLEATEHKGHHVTDMERRGEPSDIVDENNRIMAANKEREAIEANIERLKLTTGGHVSDGLITDPAELRAMLQNYQLEGRGNLSSQHTAQSRKLETLIQETYGDHLVELKSQRETYQAKLDKDGIGGFVRNVSGLNALDSFKQGNVDKSIDDIDRRISEMRGGLEAEQKLDHYHLEHKEVRQQISLNSYAQSQETQAEKKLEEYENYWASDEYSLDSAYEIAQEYDVSDEIDMGRDRSLE